MPTFATILEATSLPSDLVAAGDATLGRPFTRIEAAILTGNVQVRPAGADMLLALRDATKSRDWQDRYLAAWYEAAQF